MLCLKINGEMINKILLKIDKLKKNKLFWQIFLPLIFLFLISLLAAFISLSKQGYYILGGDLYYPLKPQLDLLRNPFTWDVRFAAGGTSDARQLPSFTFFLYFYLLDKLSIPLIVSQMIAIFSIFTLTPLAMYYLVLVIAQDQKNKIQPRDCLIAFIAGLFYNFNLWSLLNLSPPSVHLQLSYLATPLVLAFFIKGIRKFDFLYISLIAVVYILIVPAASNPILILNTLWPVVFFIFFTIIKQIFIQDWKKFFQSLAFTFIVFIVFILINFWWLLPMLNDVKTSINVVESSNNLWGWLDWKSKISSFLNIFRLTNNEAWIHTTPGALIIASAYNYISNPFLIIMSFIFPILAFSNLLKKKKNFYVLFFSVMTITMIFLAKGVHNPLGWFNKFLHQKILILSLYRSVEWYTPMIVLGYAYLLGEGSLLVYDFFKKRKNWLAGTFIMTLIMAIFIFNYPFWTGRVVHQGPWTGEISYPYFVKIPSWYFEASNWINNQNDDFKIVSGPGVASYYCADWGFAGGELGIFLFNKSIINNIFGWGGIKDMSSSINSFLVNKSFVKDDIFPLGQILGLVNAKYITLRHDVAGCSRNGGTNTYLIANQLKLREDILLEKTIGRIDFFKNNRFLPHFYIPKNIIYSNGDIESLADIVGFKDYQIRSGIYLQEEIPNSKYQIPNKFQTSNSKEENKKEDKVLDRADETYVKAELKNAVIEEELGIGLPGVSFPYVRHKPAGLMYRLVLMNEHFDKWKVRKNPEKIFEKDLLYASKRITEMEKFGNINKLTDSLLTNYKKEMEGAIELVRNMVAEGDRNKVETDRNILKLRAYLEKHKEKINGLTNSKLMDWNNVFDDLENKITELKPKQDFSKLVYKFDIPRSGNYSLFISKNQAPLIKKINGLTDYLLLDKRYFEEGERELALPFSGISGNLIDENLEIQNYQPDAIYRISFDYKAPKGGSFFVAEGERGETAETKLSSTGDEFRHFEMFFKSSPDAQEAAVHLSISVSEEKNLRIERIYQPEVILKNIKYQISNIKYQTPKITFVKINPTKYRVKIEGAVDPYTLVFSESFHQRWKLYINELTDSKINELKNYGEIVASYFDGEIKEGTHRNIFLDKNTFETWGEKAIPEENHLLVNGYANSWYITPEDADGRQDYELIVEFAPQRLFYIGLFISGITLTGCLIYLLYNSIIVKRNSQ